MRLGCKILHLEDNDDDSFLFVRALEELSFSGTYRRVSTVEEATAYLTNSVQFPASPLYTCPDNFVTDGVSTAPRIAAWLNAQPEFSEMIRIVLTGGARDSERLTWISLGFRCVLPKGGSPEDMTNSVKEILR
jgi:hypothetical protein